MATAFDEPWLISRRSCQEHGSSMVSGSNSDASAAGTAADPPPLGLVVGREDSGHGIEDEAECPLECLEGDVA